MVLNRKINLKRVLFICLGNINRSPAAELIWKKYIHQDVQSAGLKGNNKPISKKMRTSLIAANIDEKQILHHRSKIINLRMTRRATVIFCMTPGHMKNVAKIFPKYRNKLELLPKSIGKYRISDPGFSSDIIDFEDTISIIKKSILFYNKK